MKHSIHIGIVVQVFVVLLFLCGEMASASGVPVSDTSEVIPPAKTAGSEYTDAAHIIISADRATATTSPRSAPILISADLNHIGNLVPDGTVVDFTISSGIGTLSGVTTTVNGVANVRLTSTTVGTVIVSASTKAVSATVSASFIAQPEQAIVKVATAGTLDSGMQIGGILASVTYPVSGYAIFSGGVSPSGVANGATTTLAANVETVGQVILALLDVNGLLTGEFATLTFMVADGFLPNIGDFSISPATSVIAAVRNATIPGIGVVVQSLKLK